MTDTSATQVGARHQTLSVQLKYCRRLPTLPSVALRVMDLAEDTSATLQQFEAVIGRDPALAGKLMRVANSPFYGQSRTIANLSQAVNLLGINATAALALSFSLQGSVASRCSSTFDAAAYWRRSLLTALAARTLADELHEAHPDEFLLAGLLQDVGVLAMDALLGDAYAALHSASTGHEGLLQREVAAFGYSHVDAGASLLHEWRLPDKISNSVRLSHQAATFAAAPTAGMDRLPVAIAAAARMADAWIVGGTPEAFESVHDYVRVWLGIEMVQFQQILADMAAKMPEMESLFGTRLADAGLIAQVEASAREVLMTRNLKLLQGFGDTGAQLQGLEHRTTALENQTQRDPMTGLYNRAYLERVLEREFARATAEHQPLSLAFIDVDHFKEVNDTFGHAAGDQALITVARRLFAGVRQADTVARYGGEEFVILLTDIGTVPARAMMERMLAVVRDTEFRTRDGVGWTITFSIGVATHMERGQSFASPAAMLEAADRALYLAKRTGRGRVVVAE